MIPTCQIFSSFRYLVILLLILSFKDVQAQQSNTLFFMHSLPEANYINPAVQTTCGVFIGLPLVSSFHMNIANSGFTANQLLTVYTDNTIQCKTDMNTDRLARRNYFVSEFHSVLLAIGVKRDNLYYSFTVTEKNNSAIVYTDELVAFSLRGAEEFEGRSIKLKGTRVMFNHLREYALGISKNYSPSLTLGFKVKLLFGKFNFSTGNSSFGLSVDQGTQDIVFDFDVGFNSSLPWSLVEENPGTYRFHEIYEASLLTHLMNVRNPGLAFDVGFIYQYDDRWILSGSLLDVGMLFYRSNLNNYSLAGDHVYQGPFGNGQVDDDYLWDVFDELNQSMEEENSADPYVYFLDPRLYLGATRKLNKKVDLNFLLYNRFLPGKIHTGATLSALARPSERLETSLSWSYMNNSLANLGVGLGYGKNPLQIYLVSDNILGFILPFYVKNVNLRLGINLNLGCRERFNVNQSGCEWLKKAEERRLRMERFRHGKQDKGN